MRADLAPGQPCARACTSLRRPRRPDRCPHCRASGRTAPPHHLDMAGMGPIGRGSARTRSGSRRLGCRSRGLRHIRPRRHRHSALEPAHATASPSREARARLINRLPRVLRPEPDRAYRCRCHRSRHRGQNNPAHRRCDHCADHSYPADPRRTRSRPETRAAPEPGQPFSASLSTTTQGTCQIPPAQQRRESSGSARRPHAD